jgi:enoyl-[acyl-carrier-protein] reductase (NADH)
VPDFPPVFDEQIPLAEAALPAVERLQAVELGPRDVLVATVAAGTSSLAANVLLDYLRAKFPDNAVRVIGAGVTLAVYRPEEASQ